MKKQDRIAQIKKELRDAQDKFAAELSRPLPNELGPCKGIEHLIYKGDPLTQGELCTRKG